MSEERKAFIRLIDATATLTNIDNVSNYFRTQGDWDRVKTTIREARKLLNLVKCGHCGKTKVKSEPCTCDPKET